MIARERSQPDPLAVEPGKVPSSLELIVAVFDRASRAPPQGFGCLGERKIPSCGEILLYRRDLRTHDRQISEVWINRLITRRVHKLSRCWYSHLATISDTLKAYIFLVKLFTGKLDAYEREF